MGDAFSKWRDIIGSQPLEDYLAERFGDKTKFRISKRTFRPIEQRHVRGGMVAARCFVLRGTIRYSFGDEHFDLTEGDYCELPRGSYSVEILGDSDCMIVLVFALPPFA
jgi:mannose-6-phosphate isomerase-like protein (cupin superfamily)